MNQDPPQATKHFSAFTGGYNNPMHMATIMGLHTPFGEEETFQPHWEPVVQIQRDDRTDALKAIFLAWDALSPTVDKKQGFMLLDGMTHEAAWDRAEAAYKREQEIGEP